jgi:signal transduction histidine kinase
MLYRPTQQQRVKQYVVSVLLVCTASILTLAVRPWFDGKSPLLFFTLAVLFAAGYGGAAQGLLATALSLAVALSFSREHALVLVMAQSSFVLFAVLGVAVSIVLGKLHHTNKELTRTKDELRLSNEKLADHTDALSRSNAELQRFAYAAAHDLQTPLRTISTMADFCLERSTSKFDRESTDSLTIVVSSAKRMSRLIADLLMLAKVDYDHRTPHDEVDTARVAKLALLNLRKEIDSSEAKIALEPLPVVRAHEAQIVQLFQNLLSNSLKYRSEEEPIIQVSATQEDGQWRFSISDNGIGIDPRYHTKVFEPFQRLHSPAEYDGSGVGLAICKRIVEQHGGRIWIESAAGKGAQFYFTVPAVEESKPLEETAHLAEAGTIQKRARA